MAAAASNLLGPTGAPGRTAMSWPGDIPTPGHALARGFFFSVGHLHKGCS